MLILSWLAFSILVAMLASRRMNRSAIGWFALSVLLSPLVAGLACLILGKLPEDLPVGEAYENWRKEQGLNK